VIYCLHNLPLVPSPAYPIIQKTQHYDAHIPPKTDKDLKMNPAACRATLCQQYKCSLCKSNKTIFIGLIKT